MATDQITLTVDGKAYAGWQEVSVDRSLGSFAHSFDLSYIDRWSETQTPWPIRAQAAAQVKYGNHILVTGWVDASSFKLTHNAWTLRAAGRSLSGDLVDCSAIHESGEWRNKRLVEIARDLVRPYGLTVTITTLEEDRTPIQRFTIEEGETVQDALDRLCKNRGFLCYTIADGNVALVRFDTFVGVVGDVPVNDAIEREMFEDDQDRYSEYRVRAQKSVESEDEAEPSENVTVLLKADGVRDAGVTRHRPKVVVADGGTATAASLKQRAQWEANVRAGRSVRVRYTFPGILDEHGFPWAPGDLHHVADDALGVDENMLVTSARVQVADRSLTTEVEFVRPESFSLLEFPSAILNRVTKRGRPLVKRTPVLRQQR